MQGNRQLCTSQLQSCLVLVQRSGSSELVSKVYTSIPETQITQLVAHVNVVCELPVYCLQSTQTQVAAWTT